MDRCSLSSLLISFPSMVDTLISRSIAIRELAVYTFQGCKRVGRGIGLAMMHMAMASSTVQARAGLGWGACQWLLLVLALLATRIAPAAEAAPIWTNLVDLGCWLPGIKYYHATLTGSSDPVADCLITPGFIGNQQYQGAAQCSSDGKGGAIGVFYLDVKKVCDPQWGNLNAQSCSTTPGYQTWSGILWGIPYGRSWEDYCNNAWATVRGVFFNKPTRCINRGPGINMSGEFDVPEPLCH